MMRFRYTRAAVRPALLALVALSGCATHTTKASAVLVQPPTPAAEMTAAPTPAPTASNEIPSAGRPVKAREPALVATTQVEPCVFSGSLLTSATLYSQATGGQTIASLDASWAVQIARLELPSTPDGRARVIVGYPIHMEAYIDENKHFVQIDRRVDVVPGHVWLDPGRLVHASFLFGDTARISVGFLDGTMPPYLVRWLSCADLSLRQAAHFNGPTPMGDTVDLKPERISIHESAGGPEIAAIQGPTLDRTVWLVEKKPGWLHVEGYGEFHFNGWIRAKSAFFPPPEWGMIGLLAGPEVTHQVTRPIPLRIEATDAAPEIAKAATGAEILIDPGPPGYRVIRFALGVSAPDGASFFACEADLRGAVRLADGVEPGAPESPDPQVESASAPSTPMPPPAPILPLVIEKIWDIAEVPGHPLLEEGARRFRKGDWAGASKELSTAVKGLSVADFEARMIGQTLLGRACERKGDDTCAGAAYAKVLELAKSSAAKALVASGGNAATKRLGRLLLAQGEALFYKAEQKREAADAIQFPIYHGSGDRDDVLEHITTKIMDWIKEKRPLLEEAGQAYSEILELKPTPPPAWVVLAAGRSGDIWSAFVYEFQTLPPIPSEWNGTGNVPGTDLSYEELRREYRRKLAEGSAPQWQRAAKAYKSCRDHAKKHGVLAAEGKRCEDRLVAMGAIP